jgi:hypothetical protein
MKKKTILSLLTTAVIVAAVMFAGCLEYPKNIVVDVQVPLFVNEKEEFNIIVTVENTAENPQELVSWDIADSYLKGISITCSDPPYKDDWQVPIFNTRCYEYHIDIPAGGKQTVNLTAISLKKGDYSGDMDICINSESNFLSRGLRTIVE